MFLPSLTTTNYSKWREKVNEIRRLNIQEISLFPTALNSKERQELFKLLEQTQVRIPHIHLRHDMSRTGTRLNQFTQPIIPYQNPLID